MTRRAYIECNGYVLDALRYDPYCHQLKILRAIDQGDHTFFVEVWSPLVRGGSMVQDLVLEPQRVRFKHWNDT